LFSTLGTDPSLVRTSEAIFPRLMEHLFAHFARVCVRFPSFLIGQEFVFRTFLTTVDVPFFPRFWTDDFLELFLARRTHHLSSRRLVRAHHPYPFHPWFFFLSTFPFGIGIDPDPSVSNSGSPSNVSHPQEPVVREGAPNETTTTGTGRGVDARLGREHPHRSKSRRHGRPHERVGCLHDPIGARKGVAPRVPTVLPPSRCNCFVS